LTYICWTYLLAALPPKSVIQQIYQQSYGVQQNNPQQPYQQQPMQTQQTQSDQQRVASPIPATVTAGQSAPQPAPASSAQPIPQPSPAAQPVTVSPQSASAPSETAEGKRVCSNCGEANNSDSLFCHKCGKRLL
ncbi:MAG: zinc-ribbon domain-containing protein, partial [Ruminiclostridium sp.]|nr:zinc-ribbon domain-containing protein [Ruminiclostridium sp.]